MSRTYRDVQNAKAKKKLLAWKPYSKKHHGNPLKGCQCALCRDGLRRGWGDVVAKRVSRSFRHQTKAALRNGQEAPEKISLGYTD